MSSTKSSNPSDNSSIGLIWGWLEFSYGCGDLVLVFLFLLSSLVISLLVTRLGFPPLFLFFFSWVSFSSFVWCICVLLLPHSSCLWLVWFCRCSSCFSFPSFSLSYCSIVLFSICLVSRPCGNEQPTRWWYPSGDISSFVDCLVDAVVSATFSSFLTYYLQLPLHPPLNLSIYLSPFSSSVSDKFTIGGSPYSPVSCSSCISVKQGISSQLPAFLRNARNILSARARCLPFMFNLVFRRLTVNS